MLVAHSDHNAMAALIRKRFFNLSALFMSSLKKNLAGAPGDVGPPGLAVALWLRRPARLGPVPILLSFLEPGGAISLKTLLRGRGSRIVSPPSPRPLRKRGVDQGQGVAHRLAMPTEKWARARQRRCTRCRPWQTWAHPRTPGGGPQSIDRTATDQSGPHAGGPRGRRLL